MKTTIVGAKKGVLAAGLAMFLIAAPVMGDIERGEPAPNIRAVDIEGRRVEMAEIIASNPYLLIVYCFSPSSGEELAVKLQSLQIQYGRDNFQVIALGMEQDEAALKDFAQRLGIRYYVVDAAKLEDAAWLETVKQYPLTMFVEATARMHIDHVLAGSGASTASLLTTVAETFFRQKRDGALAVIEEAAADSKDPETVELHGFILAGDGKLDEAEEEFGSIESYGGLAKVALERGEYEEAVELADKAGDDVYALSVKAEALVHLEKPQEAAALLESAPVEQELSPWKQSEVVNSRGRIKHFQGDVDGAIADYRIAREIDSYGIKPLSNEAAALREQGNLEEAEKLLVEADRISDDSMVALLLQQVRQEMEAANDLKRQELIRGQIQGLKERYKELREAGLDAPADAWSTRPMTLALLPAKSGGVFFERAGTETALQREIETKLQGDPRVRVLERTMLEHLLQELELGSSELADASTQQVLGRVLSARYLGFFDFLQTDAEPTMYLRLVDTETTMVALQVSGPVSARNLTGASDLAVQRILSETVDARALQGLVADVGDDDAVMINIGRIHGVTSGQIFDVLVDGDPVEINGKVIAHKPRVIGRIVVNEVEEEYAVAAVQQLKEGAALEKGMKVKASAPSKQPA